MAPLEIHVGDKYESLWDEIRAAGYQRMRVDGQTYQVDQPPEIDRRRKHTVEVIVDRATIRPDARSRIADSVESALSLGAACCTWRIPAEDVPEPRWRTEIFSQHFACDRCGRSFEQLTPHSFSFNSSLGWCQACEGLGTQTGANTSALLRDPKLTLKQGAVALWPGVDNKLFQLMLAALSQQYRRAARRPFRAAHGQASARGSARGGRDAGSTWRRRRQKIERTAVPLSIQGALSGAGRSVALVDRLAQQARPSGRRSRMLDLCRQPAARRCLGRAAARRNDRRGMPQAARRLARPVHRTGSPPRPSARSPASWCARCATACNSWSTSGWSI